jgi:hypothetical protein
MAKGLNESLFALCIPAFIVNAKSTPELECRILTCTSNINKTILKYLIAYAAQSVAGFPLPVPADCSGLQANEQRQ